MVDLKMKIHILLEELRNAQVNDDDLFGRAADAIEKLMKGEN